MDQQDKDLILEGLYELHDTIEERLDTLRDNGVAVLDPRRVKLMMKLTQVENLIVKIARP